MKSLCSKFTEEIKISISDSMRPLKKNRKHRIKTDILKTMAACSLALSLNAQTQQQDSIQAKKIDLDEVVVSASRASDKIPVTYAQLEKQEIQKVNLGQDIPVLLNFLPSVVSTTFDGTGMS